MKRRKEYYVVYEWFKPNDRGIGSEYLIMGVFKYNKVIAYLKNKHGYDSVYIRYADKAVKG